jgi:hypothetical protein
MVSSKKTSTKQENQQLKSILRVSELCASAKKKGVRFCDDLTQILLITPRQVLRRSERTRKKKSQVEPESLPEPATLAEVDSTAQSDQESDPMNESYLTQHAKKIFKRLKKAVQMNNSHAPKSANQLGYYERVEHEVERRVLESKT